MSHHKMLNSKRKWECHVFNVKKNYTEIKYLLVELFFIPLHYSLIFSNKIVPMHILYRYLHSVNFIWWQRHAFDTLSCVLWEVSCKPMAFWKLTLVTLHVQSESMSRISNMPKKVVLKSQITSCPVCLHSLSFLSQRQIYEYIDALWTSQASLLVANTIMKTYVLKVI